MWDLFRSVPSIVNPGETIFSEYYALNKDDPNFSLCRVTEKQGQDAHTDRKYALTPGAGTQLLKLFMTPNRDLEDVTIDDVFDDEFYSTNFWIYWQTMFAFEKWHSALEMKLYLQRYIHHIDGLPDLSALRFTRYNQYESMPVRFDPPNSFQASVSSSTTLSCITSLSEKYVPLTRSSG